MVDKAGQQAVERAAWLIARRLRQWQNDSGELGVRTVRQVDVLRRLLEESGIRCDDSARMEDVRAFLISSPRGIEMVLSADLTEGERVFAYAHLLAHMLINGSPSGFMTRFEYHAGRGPSGLSLRERREERVAVSLARAILAGRLEGAPRYLYRQRGLPAPRGGMRRALSFAILTALHETSMRRAVRLALLSALHETSMALYWRWSSYQHLRGLPAVTGLVTRVQTFLGERESIAA